MNAFLVSARAIHFASSMLLFGELVFAVYVAKLTLVRPSAMNTEAVGDAACFVWRMLSWSLLGAFASGLAWLAAEAILMSGLPVAQAITPQTFRVVLTDTNFGHVWLVRLALLITLSVLLGTIRTSDMPRTHRLMVGVLFLAALFLAALAWAGHAGAAEGARRSVNLVSDILHLLAAGAWTGALPALVVLLGSASPLEHIVSSVERFSVMGATSVATLVVTGLVNSWLLVGSLQSLLGSEYGRLLLVKISFFTIMLAVAAVNRTVLTPRLKRQHGARAMRILRRNSIIESAISIVVVCIVAELGITVPGLHHAMTMRMAHSRGESPHDRKYLPPIGDSSGREFTEQDTRGP